MSFRVIVLAALAAILGFSAYALWPHPGHKLTLDLAQCENLSQWYKFTARLRDRGVSEAIQSRRLDQAAAKKPRDWAAQDATREMHVGITYAYAHKDSSPMDIYKRAYLSCATDPTGATVVRL